MFSTEIHFRPSLIFVGKVRTYQSLKGSTLVCSNLVCKYYTRIEVNFSGKHSSLLQYTLKSLVVFTPSLLAFFSLGIASDPYSRQGKYSTLPVCGVNLANSFGTNGEQLKRRQFLMPLMATVFGKNVPKYCDQCKNCHLKYAVKFKQKCYWPRTASFRWFTLYWHLCVLHKLVVEWKL